MHLLKALCYIEMLLSQTTINSKHLKALAKKKGEGRFFFQIRLKVISDESLSSEENHFPLKGQNFKCKCLIILVNGILI